MATDNPFLLALKQLQKLLEIELLQNIQFKQKIEFIKKEWEIAPNIALKEDYLLHYLADHLLLAEVLQILFPSFFENHFIFNTLEELSETLSEETRFATLLPLNKEWQNIEISYQQASWKEKLDFFQQFLANIYEPTSALDLKWANLTDWLAEEFTFFDEELFLNNQNKKEKYNKYILDLSFSKGDFFKNIDFFKQSFSLELHLPTYYFSLLKQQTQTQGQISLQNPLFFPQISGKTELKSQVSFFQNPLSPQKKQLRKIGESPITHLFLKLPTWTPSAKIPTRMERRLQQKIDKSPFLPQNLHFLSWLQWALDRLDWRGGVLFFLSDRQFLVESSFLNLRKNWQKEFHKIYILDWKEEDIALSIWIKKEIKDLTQNKIFYQAIDTFPAPLSALEWQSLQPDKAHLWQPTHQFEFPLVPLFGTEKALFKQTFEPIFEKKETLTAWNRKDLEVFFEKEILQSSPPATTPSPPTDDFLTLWAQQKKEAAPVKAAQKPLVVPFLAAPFVAKFWKADNDFVENKNYQKALLWFPQSGSVWAIDKSAVSSQFAEKAFFELLPFDDLSFFNLKTYNKIRNYYLKPIRIEAETQRQNFAVLLDFGEWEYVQVGAELAQALRPLAIWENDRELYRLIQENLEQPSEKFSKKMQALAKNFEEAKKTFQRIGKKSIKNTEGYQIFEAYFKNAALALEAIEDYFDRKEADLLQGRVQVTAQNFTPEALFYYIYAILHLIKEPFIPLLKNFPQLEQAGRRLFLLHAQAENAAAFSLERKVRDERSEKFVFKVEKEKQKIWIDKSLILENIPFELFNWTIGNSKVIDLFFQSYKSIKKDIDDSHPEFLLYRERIVQNLEQMAASALQTAKILRFLYKNIEEIELLKNYFPTMSQIQNGSSLE
ncbi:type ISP restriction/modification enzyme [Hugenholtzia roseola]|uniref:type ISP restriction/modification enzyme n=1 Tax=Hugenholtzia roseola TaxID=1002 RepID=UPI000429DEB8|nr:type ISP restriction/modification enzyme [Hugenholtzia roseola]